MARSVIHTERRAHPRLPEIVPFWRNVEVDFNWGCTMAKIIEAFFNSVLARKKVSPIFRR